MLEIAERGGLDFVTLGVNVRTETPASAAGLIEYCFANVSAPMGRLRAADGHIKVESDLRGVPPRKNNF